MFLVNLLNVLKIEVIFILSKRDDVKLENSPAIYTNYHNHYIESAVKGLDLNLTSTQRRMIYEI